MPHGFTRQRIAPDNTEGAETRAVRIEVHEIFILTYKDVFMFNVQDAPVAAGHRRGRRERL
jgi:hypothetical protein